MTKSIQSSVFSFQRGIARAFAAVRKSFMTDFTRGLDFDGMVQAGLRNPYAQSVWVASAIGLVVQPLKAVGLKFYLDEEEYEDPTLCAWWRRPALGMSYEEFLDATAGWLKLSGEFFWIFDDTYLARGNGPRGQFVVAAPDRMRHVVTGGVLQGWVYTDDAGRQIPLLQEQVIHAKRWNPTNPYRGLGEIEAARLAAETDLLAGRYVRDTYANQGDGGDYISAKNGTLTDEQRDQVTAALRAKRQAKLRGDFRPLFFSSDIEVKAPTITPPDLAFVANRLQTRHEVFIAFGVPPGMADVQASYSIGSASDYFRLIHGASMPVGNTIAGAMEALLLRQTGKAVRAYFDFDEHPTMQQVRGERIDAAAKLWAMGMPMQEINGYLDMGLNEYEGWDTGYLPFSVQPVGAPLEAQVPEPGAPAEPLDDPVAQMRLTFKSKAPAPQPADCPCCGDHAEMQALAIRQPGSSWAAHWRARQATIRMYAARFNKALMSARADVVSRVTKGAKSVAADFIFDLEEWEQMLQVEFAKAGQVAMETAGRQLLAEIGRDDAWTMPPAKALAYLKSRENFFTNIADEVHTQILGSREEGFKSGDTTDELAARIRAEFTGITRQRSLRIAMTETSAAYGAARQEALEQSGIEYKEWLTSGNENVRPSHRAAQGQIVEVSQPFIVGGASIMHPGDGSLGAPPAEIINCHCVALATEKKP